MTTLILMTVIAGLALWLVLVGVLLIRQQRHFEDRFAVYCARIYALESALAEARRNDNRDAKGRFAAST